MEGQDLIRLESGNMPLVPTEMARARLTEIRAFVKAELKRGIDQDYAVIPGTGTKPSLLQPGAEKLLEKLGLGPRYPEIRWTLEDHERGAYMVDVLCQLVYHGNGQVVAECWGSAARDAQEEVDEANAKKAAYAKKDNKPAPTPRILTMRDKGLARNTTLKMAQKSGLVGATLKAARLAVDFTQDVEDFSREVASGNGQAAAQTLYCSKHPDQPLEHHKNDKGEWWSHKLPDGKYCNEGPAKSQHVSEPPVPSEEILDATFEELESAVEPERPTAATTGNASAANRKALLARWSELWAKAKDLGLEDLKPLADSVTNEQIIEAGKLLKIRIEAAEKVVAH